MMLKFHWKLIADFSVKISLIFVGIWANCRQLPEITIFCTNFLTFARKWCKSSWIFDEQIHQFIKIWWWTAIHQQLRWRTRARSSRGRGPSAARTRRSLPTCRPRGTSPSAPLSCWWIAVHHPKWWIDEFFHQNLMNFWWIFYEIFVKIHQNSSKFIKFWWNFIKISSQNEEMKKNAIFHRKFDKNVEICRFPNLEWCKSM